MTYTTEVSHTQTTTGNRDFSVTFPFLATTDIKVQLNGFTKSLTTDYTIVQSGAHTTINFNTAPADNATIRIFRDTNIDAMEATYAAGSAIRAGDMNTNNTQLLYAAQEFGKLKEDNSVSFSLGNKGDVQINSSSDWVIKDNSIELSMMTDNSVGTNELVDESVTPDKLANFAITSSELASSSVTNAKLATDAVSTIKIQDNSISTAKIQNGAITRDKLSNPATSGFGFVPIGAVFWFGGNSAPSGYIKCNGDSIPNGIGTTQGVTTDFSALYAIVGANVPDLRGEFVRGWDDGKGTDSGRAIRSTQSDQNKQHGHSVSASITDPGHAHTVAAAREIGQHADAGPETEAFANDSTMATNSATTGISIGITQSNDGGNESRPRNVALLACIKY